MIDFFLLPSPGSTGVASANRAFSRLINFSFLLPVSGQPLQYAI
jgi:hypothetical protein